MGTAARALCLLGFLHVAAASAVAQSTVALPTTDWVAVPYRAGAIVDVKGDQQSGQGEADIVGGAAAPAPSLPAFYTKYVSGGTPATGALAFRIRLGGDQNPAGFKAAAVVGIDADRDGDIDLYIGVDNTGQTDSVFIWKPGATANTSPATMSINTKRPVKRYAEVAGTNYHWAAVTSASSVSGAALDPTADTAAKQDFNGATGVDYLLSFSVPFADVVAALAAQGITYNANTVASYVMGTAAQPSSFNQDIAGVQGGVGSATTWASLGALTQPLLPSGAVVNTAPVNAVPGAQTANGSLSIKGVSVTDAEGNLASVQLTATNGAVSVSLSGGAAVTAGANGLAALTLGGTETQIKAALATLGFAPAAGYTGSAAVTVLSTDSSGATDSDSIAITVISGTNSAPVAVNDTASTHSGKAVSSYVVGNDTDADGNVLMITAATLVSGQGTLSYADGAITYAPPTSFSGTAVVSYTVSDGRGGAASATLTIAVAANRAPVAVNDALNVNPSSVTLIDALANDSDADGDALTISSAQRSSGQGTVSIVSNTLQFNAPSTIGTTVISYTITDGYGGTAAATVTVTVGTNSAPVAQNDAATTTSGSAVLISVLSNDSDANSDALTITDASLISGQGAALVMDDKIQYTPPAGFSGTAIISYTIDDGRGATAVATVTVTVVPGNTAPVASDDAYSVNEDATLSVAAPGVLANDSDADGNSLTATLTAGPSHGVLKLNPGGGFTYAPAANYNGLDAFTYKVSDGSAASNTATVRITVAPVNDAPSAANVSATTPEDAPVIINVLGGASDPDGDALALVSATVTTPGAGSVAVNADGSMTFTPAPNYNGSASIAYTIGDGHGGTASAMVAVTILPVNDAPVARGDAYAATEDGALTVAASNGLLANDSDPEGSALSAILVAAPAHGVLVLHPDGGFTYTPNPDFSGADRFTYKANDGSLSSDAAEVVLDVAGVNDAPVANADSAVTTINTPVTINVLANDTDADGDVLSVASATTAANGLVQAGGGKVVYTPATDFVGADRFSVTITDGHGGFATSAVTVTVSGSPSNHAPVAVNDTVKLGARINALANDTDADNDLLSVSSFTQGAAGSVAQNSDGSFAYTPGPRFANSDAFQYTVSDHKGGSATAVVTVVNDAPVAHADTYASTERAPAVINVAANDTDPNGDPLRAAQVTQGAAGTVTINADGTVTYTPGQSFSRTDRFTVTVSDGRGGAATAPVTVIMSPFVGAAPIYDGLTEDPASESANSGYLCLTVQRLGTFTAQLFSAGHMKRFAGTFDDDSNFALDYQRADGVKVHVALHFDLAGNRFVGSVTAGANTAEVLAVASPWTTLNHTPRAGRYTMLLEPEQGVGLPDSHGYAVMQVQPNGGVRIVGRAPDGMPFISQTYLDASGEQFEIYAGLYPTAARGALFGRVRFGEVPGVCDMSGALSWRKPKQAKATSFISRYYLNGFDTIVQTIGAAYKAPTDAAVLTLGSGSPNAKLELDGDGAAEPFAQPLNVSAANAVSAVNGNPRQLTISITKASGLFSGSCIPAGGQTPQKLIYGVIYQKQNVGAGLYFGSSAVGAVRISAE